MMYDRMTRIGIATKMKIENEIENRINTMDHPHSRPSS